MGAISGYKGSVKIADELGEEAEVMEISSWELEIESNVEETPKFNADGWMNHIPGMKTWSGSIEGFWTASDLTGQAKLFEAIQSGLKVKLYLYPDANGSAYSGDAFIETASINSEAEGTVEVEFEFLGDGPLTMPGAA